MNKHKPSKLRLEHLAKLDPLTANQGVAFAKYKEGYNLVLKGCAGTGKTFIGSYLALEEIMDKATPYEKLIVVRSAVPTRDMGFLPGTQEEKEDAYTGPYKAIINDLFDDKGGWDKLTQAGNIEFLTTSFIRGLTIKNAIVLIDEAQNCNYHELCSVITRLGPDTKIIISGDYHQSDFKTSKDQEGINQFTKILDAMNMFETIEFGWEDIVRSGLVREFLMTKELVETGKL
jgi:predicted ribonuclease YlaK|tara:strand:+ start:5299 stop:5991 length:693 start_codon:yes stop_codon:yes gene_type:complete